ncbi:MAG: hypothetical protein AB7H93_16555 [Vicinamibacterales bacterium]
MSRTTTRTTKTTRRTTTPETTTPRLITTAPHHLPPALPPSQLEVLRFAVDGDDQVLSMLMPYADAELRNLFNGDGNGPVAGFSERAIHASTIRVLHRSHEAEYRDEPALASSAFALGFMVAARLFGGVR